MSYKILVDEVCIESGNTILEGKKHIVLRKFQAETVDFFCGNNRFLFLIAPTGSGKTFTLTAPLIANILCGTYYEGVLGIYPTKPLTADQFVSIKNMLGRLGNIKKQINDSVVVYEVSLTVKKDNTTEGWNGKIGLVKLTRDNLEKLSRNLDVTTRHDILELIRDVLIDESVEYVITVAVPEYPYLMFSSLYRSYPDVGKLLSLVAEGGFVYKLSKKLVSLSGDKLVREVNKVYKIIRNIIGGRSREREFANIVAAILPRVLFFDEFHTWGIYEKPTVLSLVLMHYLLSTLTVFPENYRAVFSSATPQQDIMKILKAITSNKVSIVNANTVDCKTTRAVKIRGRTEVEFIPIKTKMFGPISWLLLDEYLPNIIAEKVHEIKNAKRAIIFGRRIYSVEKAATIFRDKTGITPVVITSIKPPEGFLGREYLIEKKEQGDLYVFGNYSIELGIDLSNIQYSIVIASSRGEFVQRMGRSGRGGMNSKLVVPIPSHYFSEVINHLSSNQSNISYWSFLEILSLVLPSEIIVKEVGSRAIIYHRLGKLRIYLPLASLVLSVLHRFRDKPEDIKKMLSEFVRIVDIIRISRIFRWMRTRVSKNLNTLTDIASFRIAPSTPYARKESSIDAIDGEASFITLLANYAVSLDRRKGKLVLILHYPHKKSVRYVSVLDMRILDKDLLESLYGMVITSNKLLKILPIETRIRNPIITILREYPIPVYVAKPHTVVELLHVFGHAIRLDVSGVPQAYLIIL